MYRLRHTCATLLLLLVMGCLNTGIPSGSTYLRTVTKSFSRSEFIDLDNGRRYACFLRLGGRDEDVVDGSFVLAGTLLVDHYFLPSGDSYDIAFVKPGLKAEVGDIVEMSSYAIREKSLITKIRQKKDENGSCRFVNRQILFTATKVLYCEGIEKEGWGNDSYGNWIKLPEGFRDDNTERMR